MPTLLTTHVKPAVETNNSPISARELDTLKTAVNRFVTAHPLNINNRQPIAFDDAEVIESIKSFTGAGATTGSGLVSTQTDRLFATYLSGGAFRNSGIRYFANQQGNMNLNSMTLSGSYVPQVYGTPSTNEISLFATGNATLSSYTAFLQGSEELLSRNNNPNQALAEMRAALEAEKAVLEDTLMASTITNNANVPAVNPTTIGTYAPIHLGMIQMYKDVKKLARNQGPVVFYMNHDVFARFISAQDANGKFQDNTMFMWSTPDRSMPDAGKVGTYLGADVILVGSESGKGILNTYTANTAGSITAQTGGSLSAVICAAAGTLVMLRNSLYDYVQFFSGQEGDLPSFLAGQVTIGGRVSMGCGIVNPQLVRYYAVSPV